jgi:2'-5' RNA ligase
MGDDEPVTQSVELLLDEGLDALVRADWDALAAAGLPSQGRHRQASNRPHVTLAAMKAIDDALEPQMVRALGDFPVPVRLGALSVFGRDRFVLVRAVVPDIELLRRQALLGTVLGAGADLPYMQAGHWVPHVTLAHRMTADQVAVALAVVRGPREADGYAVGMRRWDGDARREWLLAGVG